MGMFNERLGVHAQSAQSAQPLVEPAKPMGSTEAFLEVFGSSAKEVGDLMLARESGAELTKKLKEIK